MGAKPVDALHDANPKLSLGGGILLEHPHMYWRHVDKLIYLTITQEALPKAVSTLSQFIHMHFSPKGS